MWIAANVMKWYFWPSTDMKRLSLAPLFLIFRGRIANPEANFSHRDKQPSLMDEKWQKD